MKLDAQKRLAASVLKRSPKHISFDTDKLNEIKEAITKADIRSLIKSGLIKVEPVRGGSRGRIRHRLSQKRKGRRSGFGSRKGTPNSRMSKKSRWIRKIRVQRKILAKLKEEKQISNKNYRVLYRKAKGGFFRNKSHLALYIDERRMREKK
jgi:large subunit ribosomal protein L19e